LPLLGLAALALGPVVWDPLEHPVLTPVAHADQRCAEPEKPAQLPTATVERVSDGGIDTPQTHAGAKLDQDTHRTGQDRATIQALGREAAAFTRGGWRANPSRSSPMWSSATATADASRTYGCRTGRW
jgi:hypothetical protein